jgi:predicted dehydrogenase
MDNIDFGIVGCGFISNLHAYAVNNIEGAELKGVFDINVENGGNFARKYGIKYYGNINDLFNNTDAVCICTPSGFHKDYAIKAAKAGKHIVIEKPLALTVSDCDEIIKACDDNNVKSTVISQLRYSDALNNLKYAIENGYLGKLVSGSISMKYYRSPEYYKNSWRGTMRLDGGGALMNQGIHGVDLLQYVMGGVKKVYGVSKTLVRNIEVEDTLCAAVEYHSGATGVIEAATSVYPGFKRRMEICGDKGSIVIEEDEITFYEFEDKSIVFECYTGSGKYSSSDPKNIVAAGHLFQISDFVKCIKDNKKHFIDCEEGKKAVKIITSIYKSAKEDKAVYL